MGPLCAAGRQHRAAMDGREKAASPMCWGLGEGGFSKLACRALGTSLPCTCQPSISALFPAASGTAAISGTLQLQRQLPWRPSEQQGQGDGTSTQERGPGGPWADHEGSKGWGQNLALGTCRCHWKAHRDSSAQVFVASTAAGRWWIWQGRCRVCPYPPSQGLPALWLQAGRESEPSPGFQLKHSQRAQKCPPEPHLSHCHAGGRTRAGGFSSHPSSSAFCET